MTIQHNGKRFTPEEWEAVKQADGFQDEDREMVEGALQRRNDPVPELGEARTYFPDDGRGPISQATIDSALKVFDDEPTETQPQTQTVAPKQERLPVNKLFAVSYGGRGTIPQKDPKRAAEQQAANEARARERNAQAAAREAQDAKRQELLASGQYYDDGRGNIKLRKKFMPREYTGRRDYRGRVIYNDQAGQTALAIQNAGREAYERAMQSEEAAASAAKTQDVVAMNKAALEEKKAQAAEQVSNKAKGYLSIYDGMVAALQAMNDGEIQDEEKTVWGGKDENGRDARWKYDANGRIIGQADARQEKTGRRFKTGFVAQDVIDTINSNLQMRGNRDFKITGIMAKQGVDAIDNMTGEPMFYVQGLRADGQKFMRKMSAKDVYRFGVENGERSGLGRDEAEANVINGIGDLFGKGKRMSAPSEKMRIAEMQYGTPGQRQIADLREEEKMLQQSLYNKDGTPVEMSDEERAEISSQIRALRQMRLAAMGLVPQTAPGASAEAPSEQSPVLSKDQAAKAIAAGKELAEREAAERQPAQPAETQAAQPQTVADKPTEQPKQTEKPAEAPAKPAQTPAKPSKSSRRQPWVQKSDKELRQKIDEAHRIINENSAIILDRMNGSSSDDEEWIVEGINALKKRADQGDLSDSDISYLRSIMKVVDRRKNSWRSRPSKQDERPAGKPNMAPQMM